MILECIYDTCKSFYGKARVEKTTNNNTLDMKLYSYNTLVARYTEIGKTKTFYCFGKWSNTTTRHQKEFFKQNGLNDKDIKILFNKNELIKE